MQTDDAIADLPKPSGLTGLRSFRGNKVFVAPSLLLRTRRGLSLLDQAVISFSNMGTSVIIGRTCSRQQLGLYASGFSLLLLATAVQTALFAVPYTIALPQLKSHEKRSYRGSTLLQQASFSLLGILLFLCLGLSGIQHNFGSIFLVLALVSSAACFRDFTRRLSYAELHFSFALMIDSIASFTQLGLVGFLAFTHHLNAQRALMSVGCGGFIAGATWLALNWPEIEFRLCDLLNHFKTNWFLGKWLLSSSVLWSLCIEQYPWMLSTICAPAEAAVWAACYGVMAFLNPVVLALNNDAAPRVSNEFAKNGVSGLKKSVLTSALIGASISTPIIALLVIFGADLVKLMYGSKYSGVGTIVSLLAIGFGFYATGLPLPYGMLALKRPKLDFAINVICFVTFLALGIFLIRTYGPLGAALSFLIIQVVAFSSRIVGFRIALLARA